jgi:hypothetical protein
VAVGGSWAPGTMSATPNIWAMLAIWAVAAIVHLLIAVNVDVDVDTLGVGGSAGI